MTTKIAFSDFWQKFEPETHFLFTLLNENFEVELVLPNENPDILIYSIFGDQHLFINAKIKVFYTGENDVPDFNKCDYAISFQHLSFGPRHLRLPLFATYDSYQQLRQQPHQAGSFDRDFCSFVVSNGHCCDPIRTEFFEKLSKYKKVSSGGKYANNIGGPVDDKFEFLRKFKFNIAFENSMVDGYTTEKIVDAFLCRTVPIYWGNPRINLDFPNDCYIDVNSFKNINDAIEYIIKIDNNQSLYSGFFKTNPIENNSYIEWEKAYIVFFRYIIEKKQQYRTNHGYYGIRRDKEIIKERLYRISTVREHIGRFEQLDRILPKYFKKR